MYVLTPNSNCAEDCFSDDFPDWLDYRFGENVLHESQVENRDDESKETGKREKGWNEKQ